MRWWTGAMSLVNTILCPPHSATQALTDEFATLHYHLFSLSLRSVFFLLDGLCGRSVLNHPSHCVFCFYDPFHVMTLFRPCHAMLHCRCSRSMFSTGPVL